ncbi:glycine zipper domain-containing protein [Paraburkholderia sp. MM5477-R1]|uniref:glycine zipper domain-containing protein n=1 Tax=Paraburkholderia sp. MM5477-R1 TaxID=2991062 RepID=UPI003D191CC8
MEATQTRRTNSHRRETSQRTHQARRIGNAPSPTARTEAEPLDRPVALAQPRVAGTSAPAARFGGTESGTAADISKPALEVAKSAFTSAQAAVSSGYRTVSASTDEFAHESPWMSIAFAALGGIIIGMLLAR